ncbi:MAG: ABC transporter permease [Rhodospirillaceae bacterium]|nr:ABC transporter permease [Rhodospirillaceae bacterium]
MRHLTRSALRFLGTLFLVSLIVFLLIDAVPGDAAAIMLGTSAQPDTLAALRVELGLDRPAPIRYAAWIGGLLQGDFGVSYTYGVPVGGMIVERLAVTLPLALMAVLLSAGIAIPLGALAARRPGGTADLIALGYAQTGLAVPNFWVGLLLVMVFALTLGWFPSGGFPGWGNGAGAALQALILPTIALALPQSAVLTRVMRAAAIEITREEFVRTARAKGNSPSRALWRHVVPNALIPVVTMLGMQISVLIAGAVLVENVFTLPGLGSLAFQALAQRDLVVIQNVVMLFATIIIAINFVVDALYLLLDPRLRGRR